MGNQAFVKYLKPVTPKAKKQDAPFPDFIQNIKYFSEKIPFFVCDQCGIFFIFEESEEYNA